MAKDKVHLIVKEVLINDGWTITHDPYVLKGYDPKWEIDFGAEKLIAAEKGLEKIAVEVKSYLEPSFANEFHGILGQHLSYRSAMKRLETERKLFISVPLEVYQEEFLREGIENALEDYAVTYFVYDSIEKIILQWKT